MPAVERLLVATASGDEVILVADLDPDPATARVLDALGDLGVRVLRNGENRGLSYSRNRALDNCSHRHLVFVDDDLDLPAATMEAVRNAVADGAAIVGVWLAPSFERPVPWWLTGGQYHYLGVHHHVAQAKTWGACMAIDVELARENALRFQDRLGRRGSGLQSGDDTMFLAELRAAGASERFLEDTVAVHRVTRSRTSPAYLLRRAWWQGRSEVRRMNARRAVGKEWRRGTGPGPAAASPLRRYVLATVYVTAVLAGMVTEWAWSAARRRS